jgi:hypothetical protein
VVVLVVLVVSPVAGAGVVLVVSPVAGAASVVLVVVGAVSVVVVVVPVVSAPMPGASEVVSVVWVVVDSSAFCDLQPAKVKVVATAKPNKVTVNNLTFMVSPSTMFFLYL